MRVILPADSPNPAKHRMYPAVSPTAEGQPTSRKIGGGGMKAILPMPRGKAGAMGRLC